MTTSVRRPPKTAARFRLLVLPLILALVAPGALAQGRFEPALRVNDSLITAYELDQRALLLRALGAPGDLREEARARLIDERLQVQEARRLGIEVTEEGLEAGVAEFAARANAEPDQFLAVLARNGVAAESFVDFVEAGLLWREVARRRFLPEAQVTEDDVDRAVALAGREGGARVLLSEIILPARNPAEAAASEARAAELTRINGLQAFSAAARSVSVSPSRARGGRLDWLPITRLPPPVRAQVLTLPPGGVTDPVRVPNAIAVFQLRALEDLAPADPEIQSVDYAEYLIPGGGPAEARAVAERIDTCDDLYGVARDLPEEYLRREVRPLPEVPADVRGELARLDANETSTAIRRGGAQVLLMLCGRTAVTEGEVDRGEIRRQLVNQRVESYASGYLAELRADAVIVDLQ